MMVECDEQLDNIKATPRKRRSTVLRCFGALPGAPLMAL